MPEGVVSGGWWYVTAAYTITAVVLAAYGWSLQRRIRRARKDKSNER
jgi:membrane protein implicated in regulation of membrane protease activity